MPEDSSQKNFPQTIILLMKWHQLWPQKGTFTLSTLLKMAIFYFLCATFITCTTIYMIIVVRNNKNIDLADNIVGAVEGSFFNYIFLLYLLKLNQVANFINKLSDFDEFGKPDNLETFKKRHNRVMRYLYIYCTFGAFLYFIVCYLEQPHCMVRNLKENKENLCEMIIPMWVPLDLNDANIKIAVYLFQSLAIVISTLSAALGTYFFATTISMISLRVQHLKKVVEDIRTISPEEFKRKMMWCVKYHHHIISLKEDLNRCFGQISAVHYTLTAFLFGILNYQIVTDLQPKGIIHLFGWLFTMSLLCHNGQNLIDESFSLSYAIYSLNWFECNTEIKWYVKMMMIRSQKPLYAEAGIFYAYSHELLQKILEASFTYMTLLKQINMRKQLI